MKPGGKRQTVKCMAVFFIFYYMCDAAGRRHRRKDASWQSHSALKYSVSLEHVSLWNSIIVFAESQIAHLPVGTAVIYLHVSENPLLDMSTASVSSVM